MSPHTKVALVTGAGTGIGKAVALAFLQEGYRVTLTGRRQELLEQAVIEAGTVAGQALIVPTDVRDPASVRHCSRRPRRCSGASMCCSTTPESVL